ncbi:hypothetical protein FJT64_001511 [Amphibalanus amphitrite]|uniref:Uncharacterized protein n=1 Tax=Amphibalanus amphitrite TaxID=1232801 RepID=A0A6A4X604_AMPAM|nr:hypothetical protein FJT64_001511 [Amphibalanus amphitrite]
MGVSRADLTPSTAVLWAADSRRLDCVGTYALTLQLGDVIQTVQVSVLRALHSPLLSLHDYFDKLKAEFPRVFDTESTLRKMTGEPMKIELTDDAVPHAVTTARNIPFCWREDVRLQLDELMEKDIIEPQLAPSSAPDGTEETAAAAPAGGQPAPPVLRNSADDPSSVRRGTRRRRRPARLTVRWADQTYD